MTEPMRFGLVGCGVIGPVHTEAISRQPDAVLVSVAGLIPERAQTLAVAVLRFANGALGTISATTGAYPGVATRVEIFGDRDRQLSKTMPWPTCTLLVTIKKQ